MTERFKPNWTVIIAMVSWFVAAFGSYMAMSNRVTALETQRAEDSRRLERIENKLDRALAEGWIVSRGGRQ